MQYLEGETLASRLQKGPLPLDQVIRYAIEIADALDKAHRQGVVHRDLKPGNIMLTKTGARLLDFGLARLQPAGGAIAGMSAVATEAPSLTAAGTILGTLQYMAPEQLEGGEADARTDIFALGAVMYEMATGRKAFAGKSQASVISAIMTAEPPTIATLQPMTPSALDHVVQVCLAKGPDERWQSARDIERELKWIAESRPYQRRESSTIHQSKREMITWIAAAIFGSVSIALGWTWLTQRPVESATIRFQFQPPLPFPPTSSSPNPAISPDGTRIVFAVSSESGPTVLAIRRLDTLETRILPRTENTQTSRFWSPDSRFLGFFADGKLQTIDASGGPPHELCDALGAGVSGTWNRDGTILFASRGGLFSIPARGGTRTQVTALDAGQHEKWHLAPWFLPDGRHFLFVAGPPPMLYVGAMNSTERTRLGSVDSKAQYVKPGYLLFVRQGILLAQAFDPERLATTADPIQVAEGVGHNVGDMTAAFGASDAGVLAYRVGGAGIRQQLIWFDRSGRRIGQVGRLDSYLGLDLSPDASFLAVNRRSATGGDIWVFDTTREGSSRLTLDESRQYAAPIWSPDGKGVLYAAHEGQRGLFQKSARSASNEVLLTLMDDGSLLPTDWSKDGRVVLFERFDAATGRDIWMLPLSGERKPRPILNGPAAEGYGTLSPDGRWIAYTSNESGRFEIYVQRFPPTGEHWPVSTTGATQPRWRGDGKELFFIGMDRKLMAAELRVENNQLKPDVPRPLFDSHVGDNNLGLFATFLSYGVTKDGQRFLVSTTPYDVNVMTVVVNWTADLKK
jgi:serine/threonine protein kinase